MLKYKIDVIEALKAKGYTTYQIRTEKLLSESTLQKLRNKQPISWGNIDTICSMLNCQPGDILEYINEMAELKSLTDKLISSLGVKSDLFNATTATGIEERETYYRLFGHYPEDDLNIDHEKSPD